jgi:hypothetical protein
MMQNPDFLVLLRYLLTRIVRIAVGYGITYQAFCQVLRRVYFEEASAFEPVRGKPNSDSRISVLSGLARRDIRALREQSDEPPLPVPSFERQLLNEWSSRLEFLDSNGAMAPLPRTLRAGGERSFEALVAGVSTDVRARSVLDEWLRKGYVVLDDEDRVVVVQRSHDTGMEGHEGARLLLVQFAHDLMAGFDKLQSRTAGDTESSFYLVYGHALTEASARLAASNAYSETMQVAHRINRFIVERETLDAGRPDATHRFTFGFSVYHVDQTRGPSAIAPKT